MGVGSYSDWFPWFCCPYKSAGLWAEQLEVQQLSKINPQTFSLSPSSERIVASAEEMLAGVARDLAEHNHSHRLDGGADEGASA